MQLEDRLAPALFTAGVNPANDPVGAVAEIVGFMNQVNTNGDPDDTIVLQPGVYPFTAAADKFDGGTALPVFVPQVNNGVDKLTILGSGTTFLRPADSKASFRFLRAEGDFLSGR